MAVGRLSWTGEKEGRKSWLRWWWNSGAVWPPPPPPPPHPTPPPGGVALTEGWSSGQRRQHAWVQPPHCAIYKLTRAVDADLFTFMPPRGRQQEPNARAKDQVRDVYSSPAGIWSWTLTKIFRRGLERSGGALKIKHLGVSFSCCASRQRVTNHFSGTGRSFFHSEVFSVMWSARSKVCFQTPKKWITRFEGWLVRNCAAVARFVFSVPRASYRDLWRYLNFLGCFDDENQNHGTNQETYSDRSAQRACKPRMLSIFKRVCGKS